MAVNNPTPRRYDKTDAKASRSGLNEIGQRLTRTQRDQRKMILGQAGAPINPSTLGRYAKVITCALSTGFGTIQLCTGDRNNLTPDTSVTVKCGMDSWYRADDFVVIEPLDTEGTGTHYDWEVVAPVTYTRLYKDPANDGSVLATTQDNPAADDSYCTDSVTVP